MDIETIAMLRDVALQHWHDVKHCGDADTLRQAMGWMIYWDKRYHEAIKA